MDPEGSAVAQETEVRLRKALELINTHLKVAVSEGAGLGAEKKALRQEIEALKKQTEAAEKERAKLKADLKEAEAERFCLIKRHRQEVEALESRMDGLPSQDAGHLPAPHGPPTPQPAPQPPRQSMFGPLGALWGGSTSTSIYRHPAGPEPAAARDVGSAFPKLPPPPPAAHPPPPPLLALDPYQLLPGADLPIGLTRNDLGFHCHQFAEHLADVSTYLIATCPDAKRLADFAQQQAAPRGVYEVIPPDALSSAPTAFLGHMLMFWMRDFGPWADPLRHLGCSFTFGPVPQPGSSGPEAAGERHLWELLRGHAAHRWLPVVAAAAKQAADEEAAAARSGGGHSTLRGAWLKGLRRGGQPEGIKLAETVKAFADGLAAWLQSYRELAVLVKTSPWVHGLLLRALHLGLAVRAAHPLLRVEVAVPSTQMDAQSWCRPRPMQPDRQEAQRSVEFKQSSFAGRAEGASSSSGPFFLASLQPGLAFDAEALKGLGAGQGQDPAAQAVLLKEEVVAWSWHRRSSSTGKARRRSNASAGGGGPEGPLGDGAKDDHPLIT